MSGVSRGASRHGPIMRRRRIVRRRLGAVHTATPARAARARHAGLPRGIGRRGGRGEGRGSVGGHRPDLTHAMLLLWPRSAVGSAAAVNKCRECARLRGGGSSRNGALERECVLPVRAVPACVTRDS
jgi:hypothetical protein